MPKRLDVILTEKALAESRTAAARMIKLGDVRVNGEVVTKPSALFDGEKDCFAVAEGSEVTKYASRGGLKLETAIDAFGIDPGGKICLDIGASAGGFTDCLLKHGARRVYAVDVGRGQLRESLLSDERVVSLEELDIREATEKDIPERAELISIDVSFISLKLILPVVKRFAAENARCIALIKPQFEAGQGRVGKNGIVKDEKLRASIVKDICAFAEALGAKDIRTVASKIAGGDGNKETLMYFGV